MDRERRLPANRETRTDLQGKCQRSNSGKKAAARQAMHKVAHNVCLMHVAVAEGIFSS